MKATIKHIKCDMSKEDKTLMEDFIKYLQKKYPIKNNITIMFLGERNGEMSTGSRTENSELKILSKGRLNRDVCRTLAHEWVHEWQRTTKGMERGQDIGGQNEDEANSEAGSVIKKFERDFPKYEKFMYEGLVGIGKKINLINEQIILSEKENIRENFILEMKKIGIDKLPYSYSSINKFVDPETMNIHYNKHYKGYVKKLNDALSKKDYGDVELEDIVKSIGKYDTVIRNNAGGAFNHALFWKMLSPKKQKPSGEIFDKITKQYGNIKKMKDEFNQTAKDRFGSDVRKRLFDNFDQVTIAGVQHDIELAFENYSSRAQLLGVGVRANPDRGELYVTITFRPLNTTAVTTASFTLEALR